MTVAVLTRVPVLCTVRSHLSIASPRAGQHSLAGTAGASGVACSNASGRKISCFYLIPLSSEGMSIDPFMTAR